MKKRFAMIVMSLVMLTTALGGTAQASVPTQIGEAVVERSTLSAPEKRMAALEKAKAAEAEKVRQIKKTEEVDPIYLEHPTLEQVLKTMPPRPEGYEVCEEGYECGDCNSYEMEKYDPTPCTCANWTYGWDPCLWKDKKCKHPKFFEAQYDIPVPGKCMAYSAVCFYCTECRRLAWKGKPTGEPSECHWDTKKNEKEPTCTKDGYLKEWCNLCGKVFYDYIDLAKGHRWQYELDNKWNRIKKCAICGLTWQGADEDFPVPEGTQSYMSQYEEDLLHDDADLIHGQDGNKK